MRKYRIITTPPDDTSPGFGPFLTSLTLEIEFVEYMETDSGAYNEVYEIETELDIDRQLDLCDCVIEYEVEVTEELHDYYLCLCQTAHGKRYWRITGDPDTESDKVYYYRVAAKDDEEAEEVVRSIYSPDLWEGSHKYVIGISNEIDDFDWEAMLNDFGAEEAPGGLSIGIGPRPDQDEFGCRLADGRLLVVGYHTEPFIETVEEFATRQESHSSLYFP